MYILHVFDYTQSNSSLARAVATKLERQSAVFFSEVTQSFAEFSTAAT